MLGIPAQWFQAQEGEDLSAKASKCSHVLLAQRPAEIPKFLEDNWQLRSRMLVHCNGAVQVPSFVNCAQPMAVFGANLKPTDYYRFAF